MKTNVTCSLDADLVARLDAWRAPMGVGRSTALELLLESLPEPQVESPGDQVRLYFDSNGNQVEPGVHHDNPKFDMPVAGKISYHEGAMPFRPGMYPIDRTLELGPNDRLVGQLGSLEVAPPMGESTTVIAPSVIMGEWIETDEVPTTPDPAAPSPPAEPLEPSPPTSSDPAPQPSGKASHDPDPTPWPQE